MPLVHVYLSPLAFRSAHRAPVQPPLALPDRLPVWCKRLAYRAADALVFDPLLGGPLNAFRSELGLPPVHRPMHEWRHSPQLVLGLFPDWFAPPQPDWPANTRLVGFPLYDAGADADLPAPVRAFLDAGPPPVVVTPTSEARKSRAFFAAAVAACRNLGAPRAAADALPRAVAGGSAGRNFSRRLRAVQPGAAAGLRPGPPRRGRHVGAGAGGGRAATGGAAAERPVRQRGPAEAAGRGPRPVAGAVPRAALGRVLGELLASPEVAANCRDYAGRLVGGRAVDDACDAIEGLRIARRAAA